jgi:hypothetical protein
MVTYDCEIMIDRFLRTIRITFIRYVTRIPSSGTIRITFIRYVTRITFIRYAHNRKIRKQNNFKGLGAMNPKSLKWTAKMS